MKTRLGMTYWYGLVLLLVVVGCHSSSTSPEGEAFAEFPSVEPVRAGEQEMLFGTVGQVQQGQAVRLEGYGLVGGLPNTGSTVCPANIMSFLRRVAQAEMPDRPLDIEALVRSRSTSVVYLQATLPAMTLKNDPLDVKVSLLPGSDATSLRGGWLYNTYLWPAGTTDQSIRKVADAHGAVYVDRLDGQADPRAGAVIGGATVLYDMTVGIQLNEADFRTSAAARNVLNMRFGQGTAEAKDERFISLKIPTVYQRQRERFFAVVKQLPLNLNPDYLWSRGEFLLERLNSVPQDRPALEVALEAMGTAGLARLEPLLKSEDLALRLISARCLANMGSTAGLTQLQQLAANVELPVEVRVAAVKALGLAGDPVLVQQALQPLWQDASLDVALTAYEQAVELGGQTLDRVMAGQYIKIDSLNGGPNTAIVAHRRKSPRLVLVGGPLGCQEGRTVTWPDQAVTLDTQVEPGWIHLSKRGPGMVNLGTVRCPNNLKIVIQVLCAQSHNTLDQAGGLGLTYADLLGFLKFLCDQGVVQAEFWGGPMVQ